MTTKPTKLSEKTKSAIQALYTKYEMRESAIMPALHWVQDQMGYIPTEAVDELAEFMELPRTKIDEVVKFYTMYHQKPVGKYHFQVCRNLTCCMFDSTSIREEIKKRIGVEKPKEVSKDGLFSYEEVECLGSCGTAPVVMVNQDYYESCDKPQVQKLIQRLREGGERS